MYSFLPIQKRVTKYDSRICCIGLNMPAAQYHKHVTQLVLCVCGLCVCALCLALALASAWPGGVQSKQNQTLGAMGQVSNNMCLRRSKPCLKALPPRSVAMAATPTVNLRNRLAPALAALLAAHLTMLARNACCFTSLHCL